MVSAEQVGGVGPGLGVQIPQGDLGQQGRVVGVEGGFKAVGRRLAVHDLVGFQPVGRQLADQAVGLGADTDPPFGRLAFFVRPGVDLDKRILLVFEQRLQALGGDAPFLLLDVILGRLK